jgi:ribosomal protein S11
MKHRRCCSRTGSCTSSRSSGTREGRSARRRTTPAAVQEAVALAKAVGTAEVMSMVALHQADHRASPPTMGVGAATR